MVNFETAWNNFQLNRAWHHQTCAVMRLTHNGTGEYFFSLTSDVWGWFTRVTNQLMEGRFEHPRVQRLFNLAPDFAVELHVIGKIPTYASGCMYAETMQLAREKYEQWYARAKGDPLCIPWRYEEHKGWVPASAWPDIPKQYWERQRRQPLVLFAPQSAFPQ